jgi:transcriptional regulator with XRE-family HTH domain
MDKRPFAQWIVDEINDRGWTRADLARFAKVSPTAISDVINGRRSAGSDLCSALAEAFNYPPDYVFRKAGLLPELEEEELPGLDELTNYYRIASDEERREIVEFARFKTRS